MTIGEKLKRARTKMNYELDDVARETKIAKMFLIAIENDDVSALPGGVYTRNFLRTYAQFLELDEDIITAEFHDQYDIKPHFVLQQEQTKRDDSAFKQQRRRLVLVVSIVVAVVVLVLLAFYQPWKSQAPGGAVKTLPPEPVGRTAEDRAAAVPPESGDATRAEVPEREVEGGDRGGAASSVSGDAALATVPVETVAGGRDNAAEDSVTQSVSSTEAPVGADAAGARDSSPVSVSESSQLPLSSLDGEAVLAAEGMEGTAGLADVFIIEARRSVRIEVYIDGEMLSNRRLPKGQRRVYRMGRLHVVKIWNIADVAVQVDGSVFRAPPDQSGVVLLTDFKQGEMLERLQNAEVLSESP